MFVPANYEGTWHVIIKDQELLARNLDLRWKEALIEAPFQLLRRQCLFSQPTHPSRVQVL
jgi:hypothetical protein